MMRPVRAARRGLATMEAVFVTAIGVPIAAALIVVGVRACRWLYHTCATLVCWPYL